MDSMMRTKTKRKKMTTEGEREIHSIWYRSILEDGTLWCESRDLEEVKRVTQGTKAVIQESVTYVIYGQWNTIEEINGDES